jgi:hypothetical protein
MRDIFGESFDKLSKYDNHKEATEILKEVESKRKKGLCDISGCTNRSIRNDNFRSEKKYGAFLCPKHYKIHYAD